MLSNFREQSRLWVALFVTCAVALTFAQHAAAQTTASRDTADRASPAAQAASSLASARRARSAGDIEEARRHYALAAEWLDRDALCEYVHVLLDLRAFAAATRESVTFAPDTEGRCAHAALGRLAMNAGDDIVAATYFARAASDRGTEPTATDILGWAQSLPSIAVTLGGEIAGAGGEVPAAGSPEALCDALRAVETVMGFYERATCRVERRARGTTEAALLRLVASRATDATTLVVAMRVGDTWRVMHRHASVTRGMGIDGTLRPRSFRFRGGQLESRVSVRQREDGGPWTSQIETVRCSSVHATWACETAER